METASMIMGISFIVLGIFICSAGVVLYLKLTKEALWWESMLSGVLGMDLSEFAPGNLAGLVPLLQQVVQGMFQRVLTYVQLAALGAMAGLVIAGLTVTIVGVYMLFW